MAKKSFESAMKRLDEIVAQLEEGQLPLEKSIAIYEEGMALSKYCEEKLLEAEKKVRLLREQSGDDFDDEAVSGG